ncbi:hypothetical protein [Geminocystis sp. NIES-3709]|nr:hypothetical protein [Geminocystis sp. NIES-3709]BAQ64264.1 hypothetical protein GM3709_1029 [Geminocystis sp. NIES-3709]
MSKFIQRITILSIVLMAAYPAHDFMRNFAQERIARVQNTNYNFSRYLRS